MQNLYCRNVLNVKFPKIVAEKFAFYILHLSAVRRMLPKLPNRFDCSVPFSAGRSEERLRCATCDLIWPTTGNRVGGGAAF